jgi:hypothetical protein
MDNLGSTSTSNLINTTENSNRIAQLKQKDKKNITEKKELLEEICSKYKRDEEAGKNVLLQNRKIQLFSNLQELAWDILIQSQMAECQAEKYIICNNGGTLTKNMFFEIDVYNTAIKNNISLSDPSAVSKLSNVLFPTEKKEEVS